MYNLYYDQGTSNCRLYLIKDNEVVYSDKGNIGSKDVSISGDNKILIQNLKVLYDKMLEYNNILDTDIEGIYASGMITSPFGLVEVPHLSTPITLAKLTKNIYTYCESVFFKRNISLIRGAKTITDAFVPDSFNIVNVNNMRGEEIEVFGILAHLPAEFIENCAIVLPGSHTHIVYIKEGIFEDILSTFSGEIFFALSQSTILSSSLRTQERGLDEEMVRWGYETLNRFGFNRALYNAHAMKIFNANDNYSRKSFLEGIISGGVVQAFLKISKQKWNDVNNIVIAGTGNISKSYEIILKESRKNINLKLIKPRAKDSFASMGMIEILKEVYKN